MEQENHRRPSTSSSTRSSNLISSQSNQSNQSQSSNGSRSESRRQSEIYPPNQSNQIQNLLENNLYFLYTLIKIHFGTHSLSLLVDILIWILILKNRETSTEEIMVLSIFTQSVSLILLIVLFCQSQKIQSNFNAVNSLNKLNLCVYCISIIFIVVEDVILFKEISASKKKVCSLLCLRCV